MANLVRVAIFQAGLLESRLPYNLPNNLVVWSCAVFFGLKGLAFPDDIFFQPFIAEAVPMYEVDFEHPGKRIDLVP